MASITPINFSLWLLRVSTLSEKRADSSSSCVSFGMLSLSSLSFWLFLSLFLCNPNTAKECSNCSSRVASSSSFSMMLFHKIGRTWESDWPRFFYMTKGNDFSAPQNRIYFVIKWQGFPIAPCLVTIMILCIFCWSLKYFIFHWDTTTQVIARPEIKHKKN